MCSVKACNKKQASGQAKEIAKVLIDLKKTSGAERKQLKLRIAERFKLDTNEKWVATKLRLMLIKLGSCKELLALSCNEKDKSRAKLCHQKKSPSSRKSKESAKNVFALGASPKARKPRQSLEERQLMKLRTLGSDEVMDEPTRDSKAKFLEAFGLVPVMIAL